MKLHRIACFFLMLFHCLSVSAQTDSTQYYFQKGMEEKKARRFRSAETSFLSALRLNPANRDYMLQLAETYAEQLRYAESREMYLKADKLVPGDPGVAMQLMVLSFNLHKWTDALQYASRVNDKIPAHFITGRSQYELENYGEAVKFLQLASREEPTRADIPYYLARAYMEMSNYKQSAAAFEQAIALDTTRANWVYETALAFYAVPDYRKSLQYMLLAGVRGYPRSNDYMENLATVYVHTNQHPEAIRVFKEVLVKKPTDQEILFQLAQSYYQTAQYDEAISTWNTVYTQDATNAKALYMMGMAYQKKGDKQKGAQLCDKAIQMDPSLRNLRQEKKTDF